MKTRTQQEELRLALRAASTMETHITWAFSLHPQDNSTELARSAKRLLAVAVLEVRKALAAANKRDENRKTREAA